jgi:1,4-dihydroxy-2-naphthoyl-CoA hydrolase
MGGHFCKPIDNQAIEAKAAAASKLLWIESRGRLVIKPHHIAPNGFLHAAVVVGLADTACGYGCLITLPEGATGFATVEPKSHFLGTLREGAIVGESRLVHGGRTTQVWDATVTREDNSKMLALFRCTQIILYPKAG